MTATRVLLADDHALVRAGIRALIEKIPNAEVVGEANSGREALEMIKSKLPNLVLMDIAMSELGGLEALPRITKDFPGVKVIILSGHANEEYVIRALRSGADNTHSSFVTHLPSNEQSAAREAIDCSRLCPPRYYHRPS